MQGRERRVEIARGQAPLAVLMLAWISRACRRNSYSAAASANCSSCAMPATPSTRPRSAASNTRSPSSACGYRTVLGHACCGAVDAAVKVVKDNATFPGAIGQMIEPILPAVIKAQAQSGDLLDDAVRTCVAW